MMTKSEFEKVVQACADAADQAASDAYDSFDPGYVGDCARDAVLELKKTGIPGVEITE